MASTPNVTSSSNQARQTAQSDAVEKLARLGYAVKGVVHGLIGVLAVMAAFGSGGETTGSRGAISEIAEAPFGQVLLWVIAVGLAGYALWRFVQAAIDPDDKGTDAKGIAQRLGYAGSGLIYAFLTFSVVSALIGGGSVGGGSGGSGGSGAQSWTAEAMQQPFGLWLVGIAGVVTIGIGLYHFYKAYKASFMDKLKTQEMSGTERTWAERVGRFGLSARGVVFLLIGVFLIQAALQADPDEARGLEGALDSLASQPYGPYLLGLVALGLVAYGVYCFVVSRYRTIG